MNDAKKSIEMFQRTAEGPRRKTRDADLKLVMRERLVAAREMNKMTQKEAALKLGYKNSSQLSKVESGEAPPPHPILRNAAMVYAVSADWLLGISNEPERDPRTANQMAVMRSVREAVLWQTQNVSAAMLAMATEQMPLEAMLTQMVASASEVLAAFERVCRLNATFQDDIRGGANVVRLMDELQSVVLSIKKYRESKQSMCDAKARGDGSTMPLFGDLMTAGA